MQNSIFFSKRGTKNSQIAADSQSENFKYKNWMCNIQIPKDKIRGRVVAGMQLHEIF